jgi:hypothetical protein
MQSITVKELTTTSSQTSIVGRDQITVITTPSNGERTWIPALKAALNPAERGDYVVPGCMEGTRESVFKEVDDWLAGASQVATATLRSARIDLRGLYVLHLRD